jgi:hypothetical protein
LPFEIGKNLIFAGNFFLSILNLLVDAFKFLLLADGAVGAAPSVVVNQAVAAPGLQDAANWAEAQTDQVLGLTPGQDADMTKTNLFGKDGGAVAAIQEGGVQILGWGVRCK